MPGVEQAFADICTVDSICGPKRSYADKFGPTVGYAVYQMIGSVKILNVVPRFRKALSSENTDQSNAVAVMSFPEQGKHLNMQFSQWHCGIAEAWLPSKHPKPGGKANSSS